MEKVTIFLFCDALLQLLSPSRSIQGAGIGVKGSIWDIYGPKSAINIKKYKKRGTLILLQSLFDLILLRHELHKPFGKQRFLESYMIFATKLIKT